MGFYKCLCLLLLNCEKSGQYRQLYNGNPGLGVGCVPSGCQRWGDGRSHTRAGDLGLTAPEEGRAAHPHLCRGGALAEESRKFLEGTQPFLCFFLLVSEAAAPNRHEFSPHPHLSALGTQEEIALGPGSPGEMRAQAQGLPGQPHTCTRLPRGLLRGLPRNLDLIYRPLTLPPLCLSPFHCSVARRQAGELREFEPEQTNLEMVK